MVWGDMSHVPRWNPVRAAYGPTSTKSEQQEALETALMAGVNLFDTAPVYGKGASERVSNYSADQADRARSARQARHPPRVQAGAVLAAGADA